MSRMKPHHRVIAGRNIALTSGAVYALTRMVTYASMHPDTLNTTQRIITANGVLLGLWAAVWGAAAVLCVADMVNRHTRYGLSLLVGTAASWGFAYLAVWAFGGFTGDEWVTALSWLAPVGIIFGLLYKVTALHDLLAPSKSKEAG